MMKNLLLLSITLLGTAGLFAQQLPQRSPFGGTDFVWNPAMTATENYWELGAGHRQEWLGFNDAPRTTAIYAAYPFMEQRTSLGGFFMLDKTQPIKTNVIALTYAYHLRAKQRRRQTTRQSGQLSLGLMATMNHIFVDGLEAVVNDEDDPLRPTGEINRFIPNIGAGLYYASKPSGPDRMSFFFAGAGVNQLLPREVLLSDVSKVGKLDRVLHGNATIGYRSAREAFMIEPSFWFNFAGANILNSQFNLTVGKPRAFWAGLSYSLNQTAAFQLGYELGGGFAEGGGLRIGALGSFNMGDFGKARGLGYEFFMAWRME